MASTSESNAFLSEIFTIDNETGEGMLPFMMKDLSGDTIFIAEQAWVTQPPEAEYGKTVNEFEWTIETGKVTSFSVGGND